MEDNDLAVDGQVDLSKHDRDRDATPSSMGSSPEEDMGGEPSSHEPTLPQKRKGGRKPIYATSEERKQRNRQAQAAFRERRTEYIKQLEATIKQNEETLANLQQSHRTAADECLMLRYKNSLLERILLEKGINVQAELQMKTGSPVLGPGFMHPVSVPTQQSQLQRTALQRQQARRSGGSSYLHKLAPGQTAPDLNFHNSPHNQPTPSSHASSPTAMSTQSPMAMAPTGMTPPATTIHGQAQAQQFSSYPRSSQQPSTPTYFQPQQQQHPQPTSQLQQPPALQRPPLTSVYQGSSGAMSTHSATSHHNMPQPAPSSGHLQVAPSSSTSNFYTSPFQKHFDQLDQEYDTAQSHSMLDDPDADDPQPSLATNDQLPTSYAAHFDPPQHTADDYYQQTTQLQQNRRPVAQHRYEQQTSVIPPNNNTSGTTAGNQQYGVDPNDPLLDADPFGLSASMHYPTNYSFDQHQGQR